MAGTIRSFDEGVRADIKEKLEKAIEYIAFSRGAKGSVSYSNNAPVVINNKEIDGLVYPAHNPRTAFEEDMLYIGSAAYASIAIEWLKKNAK